MKLIRKKVLTLSLLISICCLMASGFSINETDLIAYYQFSGNTSDSSGNGNDATNNGAILTTDRNSTSNSAYDFDGTNDYMATPLTSFDDTFTISTWFKSGVSSGSHSLFGKRGSSTSEFIVQLLGSSGHILFLVGDGSSFVINTQGTTAYNNDSWNHLVLTQDGSNYTIYVNGVEEITASSSARASNSVDLEIGSRGNINDFFDGGLDDFIVWNRTISQEEITDLYADGNSGDEGGSPSEGSSIDVDLTAYYTLSGNTEDLTTNNNDATNHGAILDENRFGEENSSYFFDGTNDYLSTPLTSFDTDFTISTWFKSNETSGSHSLFGKRDNTKSEFIVQMLASGKIILLVGDGSSFVVNSQSTSTYNDGEWHNLILVQNGTSYTVFVDNSSVISETSSSRQSNTVDLEIGSRGNGVDFFRGNLDDIAIWDRAINSSEIEETFLFGVSHNCPIQDGEQLSESVNLSANSLCFLPNGFSIVDASLNLSCFGGSIRSYDDVFMNTTGSVNVSDCNFSGGDFEIGTGIFDFTNISVDGGILTIGCGSTCSFSSSFVNVLELIISTLVNTSGLSISISPPDFNETSGDWNVTLPSNMTYEFPNGFSFDEIIGQGATEINLDCAGSIIQGNGNSASTGILVDTSADVTIKNCIVENYGTNVKLEDFDGDSFINNTLREAVTMNWFINSAVGATFQDVSVFIN